MFYEMFKVEPKSKRYPRLPFPSHWKVPHCTALLLPCVVPAVSHANK